MALLDIIRLNLALVQLGPVELSEPSVRLNQVIQGCETEGQMGGGGQGGGRLRPTPCAMASVRYACVNSL